MSANDTRPAAFERLGAPCGERRKYVFEIEI
jgi:hypothetical protein